MNDTLPQPADVFADGGRFVIIPDYVLDAKISANAFRLYAVLRSYADNRTGQAHPSRRTLAGRMGMKDPRVVDKAVADLVAAGLLAVLPRYRDTEGRVSLTRSETFYEHTSNGYRLLVPATRNGGPRGGGVVHDQAPPDAQQGTGGWCTDMHHPSAQTCTTLVHENAQELEPRELDPREEQNTPSSSTRNTPAHGAANPPAAGAGEGQPDLFGDRIPDPVPADPAPRTELAVVSGPDRFPEFWAAYPRRVGKATARKAWDKALAQPGVDADTVIAGAWRLAGDPNRVDRYTPHPSTWLNREGWHDAPEPPREDPRTGRRSTVDDKVAGWAALKHPQTTPAPHVIDAEWTDTTDRRAIER